MSKLRLYFGLLKTCGFNREDTHVTHPERLEKLIMLVLIALVWCYKIGDFIDTQIKAIRIKKQRRRAISVSKYGLDYSSKCLLF